MPSPPGASFSNGARIVILGKKPQRLREDDFFPWADPMSHPVVSQKNAKKQSAYGFVAVEAIETREANVLL